MRHRLLEQSAGRIGEIEGELFPPPYLHALASQCLSYIFFVGLFMVMLGEYFFTSVLPMESALKVVRTMKENQMITIIVLMACNMVASQLLSTGAFEVYFNNTLVFSKIDTGLVPDVAYLAERLKNFQLTAGTPAQAIGEY